MPIIDKDSCPVKTGSIYPAPYAAMMEGRSSLRLGQAGGLTQFGANLVTLAPGAMSSLRHWHEREDEFVMVTEGECTLVDDTGAHVMRSGDCAAFPAGDPNGHHQRKEQNFDEEHESKGTAEELLPRVDAYPCQIDTRQREGDHAGDAEDPFMPWYAADETGWLHEEVDVEDCAKEDDGSEQMQVSYHEPECFMKRGLKRGRLI